MCPEDASCRDCIDTPGCGMCTTAGYSRCRPGSRLTQFAFHADDHFCNSDEDTWFHASQPSNAQCVVNKCPHAHNFLGTRTGQIDIGDRDKEVYYMGGLTCHWIAWPGGSLEENITLSRLTTWYLNAKFLVPDYNFWSVPMVKGDNTDYIKVYLWGARWPSDPTEILQTPQSWPRGDEDCVTSPSVGGLQSFPDINVDWRGPVIIDFQSFANAGTPSELPLRAAVQISWHYGGRRVEQGEFNLRTAGIILFFSLFMAAALSVLVRRFRRRAVSPASERNSCTRLSISWTVEEILKQVPSMKVRCCAEDDLDSSERNNCCSVCLVDLDVGDKYRLLPCLHRFHVQCIDPWLPRNPVCPLCRQGLGLTEDLCLPASDASRVSESSPDFVAIAPQSDTGEVDAVLDRSVGNDTSSAPVLPSTTPEVIGSPQISLDIDP